MPKLSKRRRHSQSASAQRWTHGNVPDSSDSSGDEYRMDTDDLELNFEKFTDDLRGRKRTDSFYDTFPDIEADARTFVVQACSRKSAEFKIMDLAHFIDAKYYELTGFNK